MVSLLLTIGFPKSHQNSRFKKKISWVRGAINKKPGSASFHHLCNRRMGGCIYQETIPGYRSGQHPVLSDRKGIGAAGATTGIKFFFMENTLIFLLSCQFLPICTPSVRFR